MTSLASLVRRSDSWVWALALTLTPLSPAGCANAGSYVWASQLKAEEVGGSDYVIVTGDVVGVRVFGQEAMTTKAKVRSDGKISVPFLGDLSVVGKPPAAVAKEIEAGLKNFINAPNVTVAVEEFQATTVSVIGEVAHPGNVAVERNAGVLQALAAAGGFTDNASKDEIYVLREVPVARRIRFTYDALARSPPTLAFRLRPGDVVVVE